MKDTWFKVEYKWVGISEKDWKRALRPFFPYFLEKISRRKAKRLSRCRDMRMRKGILAANKMLQELS